MSPSAQWDSMTSQQKIEWLAVNLMGWKPSEDGGLWEGDGAIFNARGKFYEIDRGQFCDVWSPLTNWNHTMEVVEMLRTKKGMWLLFDHFPYNGHKYVAYEATGCADHDYGMHAYGSSAQLALCKAAFLAMK